jgi:hypothetical protein
VREKALEARLNALEDAVKELRRELATARSESQAAAAQATVASVAIAQVKATPALPPAKPADGFTVAGTTVKINGFFKAVASMTNYGDGALANGSLGRDFYLPSQIPIGGPKQGREYEGQAKQTRIWLTTATPIGSHMLKGHMEFDFQAAPGTQGSQRTTNAYNFALRRGFVTFDNFLFGQEWSNFQYVPALPESTDYVGVTEGTIFVRQMQIRYTQKLSKHAALSVAIENPETATITRSSPTMVENGTDHLPDVTARLVLTSSMGELSLAGLARELTGNSGTTRDNAFAWGVSLAGKVPFGEGKRSDVRFMITHGEGIGRYVGLNFAPDGIFNGTAGSQLDKLGITAGFAAVRLGWTPNLRTNLMGSFQKVDYPSGFLLGTANDSAWSVAGNIFYSPVKPLDVGLEFRHGERKIVSGASGELDRLEFAVKYTF